MCDVFVSHVEADAPAAFEIARGLEAAGYTTWCYEEHDVPGVSYLERTGSAIDVSRIFLLLISTTSLASKQVDSEVVRAHEGGKRFMPVLLGMSHSEFRQRRPDWRQAVGSATSIQVAASSVADIIPKLVQGVRELSLNPEGTGESLRTVPAGQLARPASPHRGLHLSLSAWRPGTRTRFWLSVGISFVLIVTNASFLRRALLSALSSHDQAALRPGASARLHATPPASDNVPADSGPQRARWAPHVRDGGLFARARGYGNNRGRHTSSEALAHGQSTRPGNDDLYGAPDGVDREPETPRGAQVDEWGLARDSDHDGVSDAQDLCPDTPTELVVNKTGCPIAMLASDSALVELSRVTEMVVLFTPGVSTLTPDAGKVLDSVGAVLLAMPKLRVEIGGHCDAMGSQAMNERLSLQRAFAVLEYLMKAFPQLDRGRFAANGYGSRRPRVPDSSVEGRAQNRRVEFGILNPEVLRDVTECRRKQQADSAR
jgi:outer membrane protein OmpA-like peptidoglycan-associated protein